MQLDFLKNKMMTMVNAAFEVFKKPVSYALALCK